MNPKELEVEEETSTPFHGKFTAEPLERGYGITLGNALRRVMLGFLEGAAITSVRIEGIACGASTIPGVKEDVTNLILNLKELRFRLHTMGPKTIQVKAKGPRKVKAGNIIAGEDVEILNPDHPIASLSAGGRLSMEMVVRKGRGYVPAEKSPEGNQPGGAIPVDAVFCPIRKVDYTVSSARVGQRTDYDKLTLEVWTDGSLTPREAVSGAARMLDEQLSLFIPPEEEAKRSQDREEMAAGNLPRDLDELGLSARTANSLKGANIRLVRDLVQMTEKDLTDIDQCGQRCREEVRQTLGELGLRLGMRLEDWQSEKMGKGTEKAA